MPNRDVHSLPRGRGGAAPHGDVGLRTAPRSCPRSRVLAALVALLLLSVTWAQSIVIHPFGGQNLELGALVADRAAAALADVGAEVYGPEVAPTLVPPLVVPNGFLNPAAFLGPAGIDGPTGAELLGQTIGTDLAATGTIRFREGALELEMYVWDEGDYDAILRFGAPEDEPEALATSVARALARRAGLPAPAPVDVIELEGDDGVYARALTLVGAGFLVQAREALRGADALPPRAQRLLGDLDAALGTDDADADSVRAAVFSLATEDFDVEATIDRFERLSAARDLPAARLWIGVLAASANDRERATAAFAEAADLYPFGRASQASYRQARNIEDVDVVAVADASDLGADAASWLALAIVAGNTGEVRVEKRLLQRLAREAPFFTYPFERLSFIAFDEDDALAAAEALVVAVELAPDSDLYWTNLGWAYYLLGFLERSEIASERAVELDPTQFIAHYNLGLAHAVRGDLDSAMPAYDEALRFDPEVDDAAIEDLENALELYPSVPAVHYALAYLYAAEGRRADAAAQYEAYLAAGNAGAELSAAFAQRAQQQLSALRAPPAPLEISPGAELVLGAADVAAAPYHPGDPIAPVFELFTPGDALPVRIDVTIAIVGPDGTEVATSTSEIAVPTGAIGFLVEGLQLEVPRDAGSGAYEFEIRADGGEDQAATASLPFEVEGQPLALRWLLGRGVVLEALDTGAPLYGTRALHRAERLPEILVQELRARADAAAGAIPVIDAGRFQGLSGGELFRESTAADVSDFLAYLRAQGVADTRIVFAESYAQWAVEGAPTP